jgi:hypothetical protein
VIRVTKAGVGLLKAAPRKIAVPVSLVIAVAVIYLGYQEP